MGRRTYGANTNLDTKLLEQQSVDDVSEMDCIEQAEEVHSRKISIKYVIAIVLIILSLFIASVVFLMRYIDIKGGASQPEDAVEGYLKSIISGDSDEYSRYLPLAIRNDGYIADTNNIADLRILNDKYGIALSEMIVVLDASELDIKSLEKSLYDIYKTDISIKDAIKVSVSTTMSYVIDDVPYASDLTFNLISIKVGFKWYVYTGNVPSDMIPENPIISEEPETESTTQGKFDESEVNGSIEYISPIDKDLKPLEKYDGVKTDLVNGHVNIDDIDYVFPVLYNDMTTLYELVNDSIETDVRLIEPNYILKNLPIKFVNSNYGMTAFNISIANHMDEVIDVADGLVTTFYVGLPKSKYSYQLYDYPTVYLPGNITLTSSYQDVKDMYGTLERYENDNPSLYLYSDKVDVYYLNLYGSRYNKLYFEFENNMLVALQWYFYDLNKF